MLIAGEDARLIYAGSSTRSDGTILGAPITPCMPQSAHYQSCCVSGAVRLSIRAQSLRSPNLQSIRRRRGRHEAKLCAETEHSRLASRNIEHGLADALHRNGAQQSLQQLPSQPPFPKVGADDDCTF